MSSLTINMSSMQECLSTHDNPSVQIKSYVSLKAINLKPFYIKPYLTHESEIRFAEAEMEKLHQMVNLRRGVLWISGRCHAHQKVTFICNTQ